MAEPSSFLGVRWDFVQCCAGKKRGDAVGSASLLVTQPSDSSRHTLMERAIYSFPVQVTSVALSLLLPHLQGAVLLREREIIHVLEAQTKWN